MYIRKTWKAGKTVEVKKTFSARYGKSGSRGDTIRHTTEAQEAVNRRNAIGELRRTLNANFSPGDWHVVLTYPQKIPPTPEQAKRDMNLFLRKLRSYYREQGRELKYVQVTEYKHKRIHHHIVLPSLPEGPMSVKKVWWKVLEGAYYAQSERSSNELMYLRFRFAPLDESGQYGQLAEYLIKETDKSRRDPDAICKRRYRQSRNLVHPKPVVEIIDAKRWREEAAQRKGYYIDKTASVNFVSEDTGLPVQETIYVAVSRTVRKRC